jgi:hypothetical protein
MSNATDSPSKDNSNFNEFNHAAPIPILGSPHRRRSSTVSSDGSPPTPPDLQTPASYPTNLMPASSSPTSSPIFSYFMSSPPKTASFPYRRLSGFGGAPAVFEGMCHLGLWLSICLTNPLQQMMRARRSRLPVLLTIVVLLPAGVAVV